MLNLLLGEGKRRGQEAEQWRGRADKAEQQLQEAQQLIRDYQKVDVDSLDPHRFGYLGSVGHLTVLNNNCTLEIPSGGSCSILGPDAD